MKTILITLISVLFLFPTFVLSQSGMKIIEKSIQFHDPKGKWSESNLAFEFVEPRLSDPKRHSIVRLDNKTGAFELQRSREEHTSTHIINSTGLAITLLDGVVSEDSVEIKQYRLDPERNKTYRAYYDGFCGMPMNLSSKIGEIIKMEEVVFNRQNCYMLEVKLSEPMFSDHWKIYFASETFRIAGIDILNNEENNEGERLYFDQLVEWDGMKITRIRHWHELASDRYLGSDILVNSLD